MTPNYAHQRIAVLGAGETGYSIIGYLCARGADAKQITILDSRSEPPRAADIEARFGDAHCVFGAWSDDDFSNIDLIVASPGVPVTAPFAHPCLTAARNRGIPVIGDIELFAREINALPEAERPRLIGVTGTNGKSTVTAMVASAIASLGIKTTAVGNIGYAVLNALEQKLAQDWPAVFAIELSSYQLETTHSLNLDAACVLNLTQDHLDRYPSMLSYLNAKARIFDNAQVQVLNRDDPATMLCARQGLKHFTFGLSQSNVSAKSSSHWALDLEEGTMTRGSKRLGNMNDLPISGSHNALNALAAHALASALVDDDRALMLGLYRFEGLPHRQVFIAEIGGVSYYDDSKGTNVGATVAALHGMTQPVVLIAGGEGKGQDFGPLATALLQLGERARAVVLMGRDADLISRAIKPTGVPMIRANTMAEAVLASSAAARPGDMVLLSPACASFDMFQNYHHRGEVFAESVRALERNRMQMRGQETSSVPQLQHRTQMSQIVRQFS
jgi:UDP-N-acetylmuramoylalanine--D-glutamate ligase